MNDKLYAPQIDSYIEWYGRRGYNGTNNITYDEESYATEGLKRMIILLAKILRDVGDKFNIIAKDEEDE